MHGKCFKTWGNNLYFKRVCAKLNGWKVREEESNVESASREENENNKNARFIVNVSWSYCSRYS